MSAQSCLRGQWPTRLLCPWDSPGKNTGAGCHFLLQGIFLTQGLNPCLLHCRWMLYCLSHDKLINKWHLWIFKDFIYQQKGSNSNHCQTSVVLTANNESVGDSVIIHTWWPCGRLSLNTAAVSSVPLHICMSHLPQIVESNSPLLESGQILLTNEILWAWYSGCFFLHLGMLILGTFLLGTRLSCCEKAKRPMLCVGVQVLSFPLTDSITCQLWMSHLGYL